MPLLDRETILLRLAANRSLIRSFGVRSLSLFGSHAREQATPDSDVDLLVEFEEGRGLFDDYFGLLNCLETMLHTEKIDLVKTSLLREEVRPHILGGKRYDANL